MAKVLVAGCGDIGTALARRLLADGHTVTGLRRHPPQQHAGIDYLAVDMNDPAALQQLTQAYDYLFFLPTPDQHTPAGYQSVFVDAFRQLSQRLQQISTASARSLPTTFYISSTGVYGQRQGEWVDEQSATEPGRFSGQLLLQGEQLASAVGGVIVRFSGIYGPGREQLINKARTITDLIATPPSYTNRIHRDDCAAVLHFLLQQHQAGQPLAKIYLASDCDPAPRHHVLSFLAEAQGLPAPALRSATATEAAAIDQNKRCRNQRLLDAGYQFIYPSFRQGYQAVLDQLAATQSRSR